MDCTQCHIEISNWMEGQITPSALKAVHEHRKNCDECNAMYEAAEMLNKALEQEKSTIRVPDMSASIMSKIYKLAEKEEVRVISISRIFKQLSPISVAASIILAIGIGIALGWHQPTQNNGFHTEEMVYMDDNALEHIDVLLSE